MMIASQYAFNAMLQCGMLARQSAESFWLGLHNCDEKSRPDYNTYYRLTSSLEMFPHEKLLIRKLNEAAVEASGLDESELPVVIVRSGLGNSAPYQYSLRSPAGIRKASNQLSDLVRDAAMDMNIHERFSALFNGAPHA